MSTGTFCPYISVYFRNITAEVCRIWQDTKSFLSWTDSHSLMIWLPLLECYYREYGLCGTIS